MIISDVYVVFTKTMKKITSLLLVVVMLGVFIQSSHAVKCYECPNCDPGPDTATCEGKVCTKIITAAAGAFTVYPVLYYSN